MLKNIMTLVNLKSILLHLVMVQLFVLYVSLLVAFLSILMILFTTFLVVIWIHWTLCCTKSRHWHQRWKDSWNQQLYSWWRNTTYWCHFCLKNLKQRLDVAHKTELEGDQQRHTNLATKK